MKKLISAALAAIMLITSGAVNAFADSGYPGGEAEYCSYSVGGLAAPRILGAAKSSSKIKLRWSRVEGASGYEIFRKTKKGWVCTELVAGGKTQSLNIPDFRSGTSYYFKIRAYKKTGAGKEYGSFSGVKKATTKYGAGYLNFTCPQFRVDSIPRDWDCWLDLQWDNTYGGSECIYNRKQEYDPASCIPAFSVSHRYNEKNQTLEELVEETLEKNGDYDTYQTYYKFTGYKEIDGCTFAVLKEYETDDISYSLIGVKNQTNVYRIAYRYSPKFKRSYSKEINKMIRSVSLTPPEENFAVITH